MQLLRPSNYGRGCGRTFKKCRAIRAVVAAGDISSARRPYHRLRIDSKVTYQGRGAADRGQRGEAAGVIAEALKKRYSAIKLARVNSVSEVVAYRLAACAEVAQDYRRFVASRLAPEESEVSRC